MKKVELAESLAHSIEELNKNTAKESVDLMLGKITEAITTGEGVEVRGFGSFIKKEKKARVGINPRTGERTNVEAKSSPFFKPGKGLKESVNNL